MKTGSNPSSVFFNNLDEVVSSVSDVIVKGLLNKTVTRPMRHMHRFTPQSLVTQSQQSGDLQKAELFLPGNIKL